MSIKDSLSQYDFLYKRLNQRRTFFILMIVFALLLVTGFVFLFFALYGLAIICLSMALSGTALSFWAWHKESPTNFAKRIERQLAISPERQYVVEVTDKKVVVHNPNGESSELLWDDLQSVEIVTTAEGPWLCDFWYVLKSSTEECEIPLGASNEDALMQKLDQLPGYDFDQSMAAVGSTEHHIFRCWTRTEK